MSACPRFTRGGTRLTVGGLFTLLLLGAAAQRAAGQRPMPPTIERPSRVFTIEGRVSLPEGMTTGQVVVVTLTSSNGIPRQVYTSEGRFEFQGIPEGNYSLTAKSLNDPTLTADRVDADTSRTATGNLSVSLTLRKELGSSAAPKKAGVVTVAEAEQRVPKPARKAFREGVKFREGNQPAKALESLTRAIELYPDYFQALAERGDLLVTQRKLAEAADDFARALKVNPLYGPALRGAGYCKLEKGEFEEAARYLEQSVTAQPDYPNAYLLLGIAYLQLDRREQSKAALMKALSFNTVREARAHIYLGNLFAREGRYAEAADELRKYLEEMPNDPNAGDLKAVESRWRARAATP